MRRATLLVAWAALLCTASWAAAREWVDSTGKHRIQAEFVEIVGTKVKLRRSGGKELLVPIERLSEDDRKYLKDKLAEEKTKGAEESQESREKRERADQLVEEAFHLFKLDPQANAKLVKSKLMEATRLNPESIRAEFIRGLLNLLVARNAKEAQRNFANCLKRMPNHPPTLNNLAVAEVKMRSYRSALQHWKQFMEAAPELPYATQNMGRLIQARNDGKVMLADTAYGQVADLYASTLAKKDFPPHDPKIGWILMDFVERQQDDTGSEAADDTPALTKKFAGGGTGFVVHGDYLVTNRHVVDGADGLKIMVPGRKELVEAEVVAISRQADLAVLQCKGLGLPAASLSGELPRRGSDVMVLGYPQFTQLGATLKSTRGAVTSLPTAATDGMMLVDAEINSGNSGGPIANDRGEVMAVATAVFKPIGGTGGKYGAGLPVIAALPFLQKSIPGLPDAKASPQTPLAWPDVDEKVSKSTVLVLIEKAEKVNVASGPVPLDAATIAFQDPSCTACGGATYVRKGSKKYQCPHCRGSGMDLSVMGSQGRRAPSPQIRRRSR